MRTIGMIGGMSWESTAHYYRIINQEVRERIGGLHSARCVLLSLDFSPIAALQKEGRWDALTQEMVNAARALERGGADSVMICTNTMHLMADEVAASVAIPLIHIVDPTAQTIKTQGIRKVGLLGTAFTMEQDFYKGRMRDQYGLDVVIPTPEDRETVHRIIYDELVQGRIEPSSRLEMRGVIARLVQSGAQGVVLGCTELMLLIQPEDSMVPLFDTTELHAKAAVDFALSE